MEVITMDSKAYKDLVEKIEKISAFVRKCETNIAPHSNEDIWLDSQEAANLLRISTRTLQRLRKENLISYSVLRGRCLYKLSEIERSLNERLITCDPQTLHEFRHNYLLSHGAK